VIRHSKTNIEETFERESPPPQEEIQNHSYHSTAKDQTSKLSWVEPRLPGLDYIPHDLQKTLPNSLWFDSLTLRNTFSRPPILRVSPPPLVPVSRPMHRFSLLLFSDIWPRPRFLSSFVPLVNCHLVVFKSQRQLKLPPPLPPPRLYYFPTNCFNPKKPPP